VEVLGESPQGYHPKIRKPLFAIDYIQLGKYRFAVDFNEAPGLAPLRELVTPTEVVNLLKEAVEAGHRGM